MPGKYTNSVDIFVVRYMQLLRVTAKAALPPTMPEEIKRLGVHSGNPNRVGVKLS